MTDDALLNRFREAAFEQLDNVDGDFTRLAEPHKTISIVESAQGIIDNGGLRYFFTNDWPHKPPYSVFADAYEKIGRIEAANALRQAAGSFDIEQPEHHIEIRRDFLEKNYNRDKLEVDGWNDCICGDEMVWTDLATWLRVHLRAN